MADISIVTVCLNSEDTIRFCLESLSTQQGIGIDHLVVDGGSIDKTCEIVREFSPQSKLFHLPGSSIYEALNFGFNNAAARIVGILHSNDQFAGQFTLLDIFEEFNNDKDLDVFCGSALVFKAGSNRKPIRYIDSCLFAQRKLMKFGFMPAHTGLFHTASVFSEIGGYDPRYMSASDFKFCYEVFYLKRSSVYKCKVSSKVVSLMSSGGTSSSGVKSYIRTASEIKMILKEYGSKIGLFSHLFRLFFKQCHAIWFSKNYRDDRIKDIP